MQGVGSLKKSERRQALVDYVRVNPFVTDEQLAEKFFVSVATIRLDRATLHIPEVRERIRRVASLSHDDVRSLLEAEVIGEITSLELNRFAVSSFHVLPNHTFQRTGILRGHYLFAQANSLAVAVMDADIALTAKTELRFQRPVYLGEVVVARVDVIGQRGALTKCQVRADANQHLVLEGTIWVQRDTADLEALEKHHQEAKS